MNLARRRVIAFIGGLLAAGLACNPPGSTGPSVDATVGALGTAIRLTQTVQAQSQPSSEATASPLPPPVSPTAPPSATFPPPSATPAELSRPNGVPLHAAHRPAPPTIDGDLGDWATPADVINQPVYRSENWTGAADQSVSFALAWDAGYLYLAAAVTDDVHVQIQHSEMIYEGDSLEILLDADLGGDFATAKLNGDDYQIGLSPGALSGDSPEAFLWFPKSAAGPPAGVVVAARSTGGAGYVLEAAIPWSLFGLGPAAGGRYGFALASNDNDAPGTAEQQSVISTSPTHKLVDPTTWGTLILDN